MIQKRRGAARQPLQISLSVQVRCGDSPADVLKLVEDRQVPMVGSVFDHRDRILRGFGRLMLKAARMRPALLKELVPFASAFNSDRSR